MTLVSPGLRSRPSLSVPRRPGSQTGKIGVAGTTVPAFVERGLCTSPLPGSRQTEVDSILRQGPQSLVPDHHTGRAVIAIDRFAERLEQRHNPK